MKVAVLGTGFGSYHVQLFSYFKEVTAIYVFGRNIEKLNGLRDQYGIIPVTEISEIMENDEIDLVDICLPSHLHCKYALQAFKHHKHVLCETPVADSLQDARAMQKAQEASGKLLMVDLFMRFEHAYQVLADLVKGGEYGKLQKLQIQRNTPPIWGDLSAKNIVTGIMTHDIDFVSYLMGRPQSCQFSKADVTAGQCSVSLLCNYENAFAEINASSMMPMGYPFAVSYEAILDHAVVRYYEDRYKDQNDRLDTRLSVFTENDCKEITPQNNCYYEMIHYAVTMVSAALQTSNGGSTNKPVNDVSEAVLSLELTQSIQEMVAK